MRVLQFCTYIRVGFPVTLPHVNVCNSDDEYYKILTAAPFIKPKY